MVAARLVELNFSTFHFLIDLFVSLLWVIYQPGVVVRVLDDAILDNY